MEPSTGQLLTVAGNAAVTYLLVEVIWRTVNPSPATKDRFGPLVAALTGIALALAAWAATAASGSAYTDLLDAALIGLVGGLSAIGVHDVASSGGATS